MGYTVYILYSPSFDRYYIGQTENLENRIFRHNNSGSKSTKKANDWRMVYSETFERRSAAVARDLEIKKQKSRKYTKELISRFGGSGVRVPLSPQKKFCSPSRSIRAGHPDIDRDNLHQLINGLAEL